MLISMKAKSCLQQRNNKEIKVQIIYKNVNKT